MNYDNYINTINTLNSVTISSECTAGERLKAFRAVLSDLIHIAFIGSHTDERNVASILHSLAGDRISTAAVGVIVGDVPLSDLKTVLEEEQGRLWWLTKKGETK